MESITDPLGTQTFDEYNSFGQAKYYTDRMGGITTNIYDTAGNLESTTDPLGNETEFGYTPTRKQLATIKDARENLPPALEYDTVLVYDATVGTLDRVTDANGKHTDFTYNDRAQILSVKNAENEKTSFDYDLNNRLDKITYRDGDDNIIGEVNIVYDLAGRKTSVTDENGNPTTYEYDGAYRLTSITDALQNPPTSFGYDTMSNLTSQTDALGNVTNYEYDDFNRLNKIIYPEASSGATRLEENFEYNDLGEIEKHYDTAGRLTEYEYAYSAAPSPTQSPEGVRVITITDALDKETVLTYNARMQMTKVKDARSASPQEYTFTYDALGRLKTQSPRVGTTPMSFEYDEVGNRTKRIDYNNTTTNYAYDVLNRLTNITYDGASSQNATYGYDDVSRLTSAANQNGTVGFTYDNRGRLESETDVWGHTIGFSYDPAGNRLGLTLDGNPHSAYEYDDVNRLTMLTDEAGGNFDFTYDEANRLVSKQMPNGVSSTFDYDGMSRLTRLSHTTLYDDEIIYNSANQIHQIKPLGAVKRIYGYDLLDRLTSVSLGSTESYTYDEVGNRTTSHLSTGYTTGAFNRLTGTTSATATYNYNNNGSMTSKTANSATTNYTWDRENRLTKAKRGFPSSTSEYDALGRRISSGFTTGQTRFTYDGLDVIMDDGPAVDQLTHYQNGPGIDNKLKSATDGTASYFLQDHLGSTVKLTNSVGTVTESNGYDSFGRPTNASFSTRYQFTGREYDAFTGLQYSRARFYDPQIGRFISEDPIGFAGGDVNLFGYVRNNPLMLKDPMGLWPPGYYPLPRNLRFLRDFISGGGDTVRTYGPGSVEMTQFQNSPGIAAFRDAYYSKGCESRNFEYSTPQAGFDTAIRPWWWGDTATQVGGFQGSATNIGDGTVEIRVQNVAGAYSFFYHGVPNFPDSYSGPFRTIYQNFNWREPINRNGCKCNYVDTPKPFPVPVPLPFPSGMPHR